MEIYFGLGSPAGASVNDGINPDWCSLSYVSVNDAVDILKNLGKGSLLAKVDIKSTYRMVRRSPSVRNAIG